VEVVAGSAIQSDEKTVSEIVAAFDRVEAAIQARDLDALMGFYSKSYNYHRLRKSDARRIWEEVFEYHRQISSRHVFTEIRTVTTDSGMRAEIKCSGALRGVHGETGQKVTIDSWFEEVHYLVKEDGHWRIIGNAGVSPETPRFGHAPHPLF
jgi:ketosteroid isomerase-like protein